MTKKQWLLSGCVACTTTGLWCPRSPCPSSPRAQPRDHRSWRDRACPATGRRRGWSDAAGTLQAWDPATGKKVWSHNFPKSQLIGSVLATAGDLVFVGGTNDRYFRAFDAKSGELASSGRGVRLGRSSQIEIRALPLGNWTSCRRLRASRCGRSALGSKGKRTAHHRGDYSMGPLAGGRRNSAALPPGATLRNLGPQGCVGLPSMEDGYDGEVQSSA